MKDLAVVLDHRPGALAELGEALGRAGVSIEGGGVFAHKDAAVALTATELSIEAGVSTSTASSHLKKLTEARLLEVVSQGRHRYFRLFDEEVASMLETMTGVAARDVRPRRRGPADPSLAAARVCYDHLAGASGAWLTRRLHERGFLEGRDAFDVSAAGIQFFVAQGIDMEALARLCRTCLDWSERRFHLGGALGAAILERLFALGWARRQEGERTVVFSSTGKRAFKDHF